MSPPPPSGNYPFAFRLYLCPYTKWISYRQHGIRSCYAWIPFLVLSSENSQSNVLFSHSVVSDSFEPHGLQPTRLLCLWNSPGKNTGVGCHSLLQGIFLNQGLNPGLLHCRQILYHLSHLCDQFILLLFFMCHLPCWMLRFLLAASVPAFWLVQFLKHGGYLVDVVRMGLLKLNKTWVFQSVYPATLFLSTSNPRSGVAQG